MALSTRTFVPGSLRRPLSSGLGPVCARLGSLWTAIAIGLSGCGGPAGSDGPPPPDPAASPRVVSLSPAMTTTLLDLAPDANVVGRTPWCRGVDGAPVVGTLEGVDAELLVQVRPEVVLVQPPVSGIDPVILALRDRLGFALVARRLDGLEDVRTTITGMVETGLVEPAAAAAWSDAAESGPDVDPHPAAGRRILLLHGLDPFRAVGTETFLDEMVRASGGLNALQRPGWIELGVEAIAGLQPEIVVLIGARMEESASLDAVPWRRRPKIITFDHPDVFEPSSRLPRVNDAFRDRIRDVGNDGGTSEVDA